MACCGSPTCSGCGSLGADTQNQAMLGTVVGMVGVLVVGGVLVALLQTFFGPQTQQFPAQWGSD